MESVIAIAVGSIDIGILCVGRIEGRQVKYLQTTTASEHLAKVLTVGGDPLVQTDDLLKAVAIFERLTEFHNICGIQIGHIYPLQGAAIVKQSIHGLQLGGFPTGEVHLLQLVAVREHMANAFQIGRIPTTQIHLGNLTAAVEHAIEAFCAAGIPIGNIQVINFHIAPVSGAFEQKTKIGNLAHIPVRNIQIFQFKAHLEHRVHIRDVAGVPTADIQFFKLIGSGEHGKHGFNIAHIPVLNTGNLLQLVASIENLRQICDLGGIPAGGIQRSQHAAFAEHLLHFFHTAKTIVGGIHCSQGAHSLIQRGAIRGGMNHVIGQEVHIVVGAVGNIVGIHRDILLNVYQSSGILVSDGGVRRIPAVNNIGNLRRNLVGLVALVVVQSPSQVDTTNGIVMLKGNVGGGNLAEALVQSGVGIGEAVGLNALGLDQNLIGIAKGFHILIGSGLVQSDLAQADLGQSAGGQNLVVCSGGYKVGAFTDGDRGLDPLPGIVRLVQIQVNHLLELVQAGVLACFEGKDRADIGIVVALVLHKDHLVHFVVDFSRIPNVGRIAVLADLLPVHIGRAGSVVEVILGDCRDQGFVIVELLNLRILILGLVIDPLILQLIDLHLTDGHDIHIFVSVRQVGKGRTNGYSCGQCQYQQPCDYFFHIRPSFPFCFGYKCIV